MNKTCALFFAILLISTLSISQGIDEPTLQDSANSLNKIVVLKNSNQLIPLQRLDTLNVRVSVSLSDLTAFNNRYLESQNKETNLSITTAPEAKEGIKTNIVVLVGDEEFSGDRISKAEAVVWIPQITNSNLDQLSQLLFGGIGTSDTLGYDLGVFPAGSGIEIKGGLRFSFMEPEDLGYDGKSLRSKLDSVALNAIDSGVAPGIQLLVAKDGIVLYHQTYGFTRYDNEVPVNKDMLYDFASVTKITGALPALMKLHDENRFSLDATIGTYLPYFAKGNKRGLQYRRVLSHNAGLKAWIPYWTTTIKKNGKFKGKTLSKSPSDNYPTQIVDGLYLHKDYRDKIYKQIRKSPLNDNNDYLYSGLSFYLFPEIVEKLSGHDFESYVQENFYQPLGARTITYNPLRKFSRDRIIPTEIDTFFRMSPLHGTVHDEGAAMMRGVSSNAGLFGSTLDLAKVIQMYLWMGEYGGERYISTSTMEKFTSCHYCNEGNRRGLAFDKPVLTNKSAGSTAVDASDHSFGHSGYTGTFAWADPDTGILFIFMSNRVYPTRDNPKLYRLNVRPTMHQIIYDHLE